MPQPTVFLGLGSNLGDREANLLGAERALERCPDESRVALHRPRETGTA
jgi:7,8-dihydro-6-hydroxymethylpterin-pyrophosphokinase